MPFGLNLSQLNGDRTAFERAVNDYIAAMNAFSTSVNKPRPSAHPFVEASVKLVRQDRKPDVYVADYDIIDDTPLPPEVPVPSLEDKKSQLVNVVHAAENAAKFKILPQRSMRLAILKYSMALTTNEDVRTAEQKEDIASYLLVQKAWQQIELVGAQAEADIDGLTEDIIEGWQLPKFG